MEGLAGFGPSGRNGGWVSGGLIGSADAYAGEAGRDAVLRAYRETYAPVDHVGEAVEREGIDCGFRKGGSLFVATTKPQLARLRGRQRELEAVGVGEEDSRLGGPEESIAVVGVEGCLEASYSPHCARVDPGRLVRGLAEACERLGVTIYERTPVTNPSPRRLVTPNGTV